MYYDKDLHNVMYISILIKSSNTSNLNIFRTYIIKSVLFFKLIIRFISGVLICHFRYYLHLNWVIFIFYYFIICGEIRTETLRVTYNSFGSNIEGTLLQYLCQAEP